MADKILNTRVFLRRDQEAAYVADFVYGKGEVLIIDTSTGIKVKIGDGATAFKDLQYYNDIEQATSALAGIMKLYTTSGQNTDGTMTQKSLTDAFNAIGLGVDSEDEECLVMSTPW